MSVVPVMHRESTNRRIAVQLNWGIKGHLILKITDAEKIGSMAQVVEVPH
jgi:hypothetical protein